MLYKNILVPVDGSDTSIEAVKHATAIAQANGSQLTLISIVSEDPYNDIDFAYYYVTEQMKDYFIQAYAHAEQVLQQAREIAQQQGVEVQTHVIKSLHIAQSIIKMTQELNVDAVVMGSHGRKGLKKMFLGSVAVEVLTSTKLPVMIIKSKS